MYFIGGLIAHRVPFVVVEQALRSALSASPV
jgi:hypothetical protein